MLGHQDLGELKVLRMDLKNFDWLFYVKKLHYVN